MNPILFISNGPTEDAIGAQVARGLPPSIWALPLVGQGKAYEGVAERILGPRKDMPSGGFLFGSLRNLLEDLKAGWLSMTLAQWRAAQTTPPPRAVVVVGDAYALSVGVFAARGAPLYHLNPLVSAHYLENLSSSLELLLDWGGSDFTPYERLLHRRARAVFVRDEKSQKRLHGFGIRHAYWYGSFAMDLLSPPERDLAFLGPDPGLALLPGTRGDEAFSLPLMLEASQHLPLMPLVAWPKPWEALPPLEGWARTWLDEDTLRLSRGNRLAWVLRHAFSAILHRSTLALATAGTATEQAAGLGLPIVAFPTLGPQYTRAFARRQKRLLGEALRLVEADPYRIAGEALILLKVPELYQQASQAGKARIGPPGGIGGATRHIREDLEKAKGPA
ncbi:lipid-A-disaccharide synthase-related protein [Thermus sp.]|uniref:lipid-A-disaccharide synthase-related protein n=1 Tax=Thermus sp. TaxID=275 RepID=UPI00307F11B2